MARLRTKIDEHKDGAKGPRGSAGSRNAPRFAPGGQSTQMIIGADASDDKTIIETSANLYSSYRLRRVYYSAFSPIPDASRSLPLKAPPLVREHRLYQADWLMRFYGFSAGEVITRSDGMLDLDVDPKLGWALKNPEKFPMDLNRAPKEDLLRVPGLGVKAVNRIVAARRIRAITTDDLARLRVPVKRVLAFAIVGAHRPSGPIDSRAFLTKLRNPAASEQLSLFEDA